MELSGETAVVTGAARGIGQAIAKRLSEDGAHIVILDVSDSSETVEKIKSANGTVNSYNVDVTNKTALKSVFEDFEIDILVNNAAVWDSLADDPRRFDKIDDDEWDAVMDVNVKGVFLTCKVALPSLISSGNGRIINIASTSAIKGTSGYAHYVASKAAVMGLTRTMANDVGDEDVRINAIAPGLTHSGVADKVDDDFLDLRQNEQAISKRPIYPEDIARTVSFLSGPDSEMISGQTIVVDGGTVM
jgi:NAD(P)-dependent dehydrogenase (short-subunit alcohol dehydrogenase family)